MWPVERTAMVTASPADAAAVSRSLGLPNLSVASGADTAPKIIMNVPTNSAAAWAIKRKRMIDCVVD